MTCLLGEAQNISRELECTLVMTLACGVSLTSKEICSQVSLRPGHGMC